MLPPLKKIVLAQFGSPKLQCNAGGFTSIRWNSGWNLKRIV
jgi:hypothetical protein